MTSYCITARNSDHEQWVYGPFDNVEAAEEYCAKLQEGCDEIDYEVASLLVPMPHIDLMHLELTP